LKKFVEDKGGFDNVCKGKRWAEIGRDLGYSGKIMSSLSTSLKNSYQKWLQPYEDWLKENKPAVMQAQHDRENGTPYTPSPGPVSNFNTPRPVSAAAEPAIKASQILQAKLNDGPMPPIPTVATPPPQLAPPPPPSGFTAVNSGFTAVNAPPPSGFAAINVPSEPLPSVPSPIQVDNDVSISNGAPSAPSSVTNSAPVNGLKRQMSMESDSVQQTDDSGRRSKRVKRGKHNIPANPQRVDMLTFQGDSNAPTVTGSQMMQPRLPAPGSVVPRDRSNDQPGDCDTCGKGEDAGPTLVCDSCDATYHKQCLDQAAKTAAPEGEWHCQRCLVGTQEYGFEEGGTYSLKQFQEKAQNFKNRHFAKKMSNVDPVTGKPVISEEEVEREFWRLTESLIETVEVEYGADIHSTTHGSAFPTIEKHPFNEYSTDPWNLNVMPLDKDSLFRHIKTDISGMTVPWLYVGMCFSTFCWHNEDHYTYSANYQHFGETKTWYGIPSSSADRFEEAMKEAVPELFEQHPDLLFHLVTLLQPEKLQNAGVQVYALDQRAGEFVITFPQAYHAGFNHGFNFNEAVNFAPSDWEPYGADAVIRLQEFRRQPVFSHDELLLAAAEPLFSASAKDHCIKTAKWLAPALQRVMDRELRTRATFNESYKAARASIDSGAEVMVNRLTSESDQYQFPFVTDNDHSPADEETVCEYCKCYGFLSRFVCKARALPKVLCLHHAVGYECCTTSSPHERITCVDGKHEIHLRQSAEQLAISVQKVIDISNTPEAWAEKLDALLEDEPRPALKSLRTIVTEGEKIDSSWPLPRLAEVKEFVGRCNQWVDDATVYTARKTAGRRKSEMRSRGDKEKAEKEESKKDALRNPENIKKLLDAAQELSFECPELDKLQERYDRIHEFRSKARATLKRPHLTETELDELIEEGKDIDMELQEMKSLENRAQTVRWFSDAKDYSEKMSPGSPLSLEELVEFIERGRELDIPMDGPFMRYFADQKSQGEFWESKAKEIMSMEPVNFHQLDALYKQASLLPVSKGTLSAIDDMLKKQREAQERIMVLYERTKDENFRNRPHYKEVRDTMEELAEMNSKPPGTLDLEREQKRHEDWMRRGKKLFGKANAPLHILLQHMQFVQERNDACLDLRDQPRMPVEPASREQTPEESDTIEQSHSSRDVFCICRKPESGMMIECELCHEWYHGRCLKIARGKVKEDDKYTCPICDYRVKIPRDAARPKLEELQAWQDEIPNLPFQPEEEDILNHLIELAQEFRNHIAYLINPISTTPDDLSVQRFYLRKIEGADVLLVQETNFLRQEMHKWAPVAPEPPKLIEVSLSTRKPRPTKAQKLMNKLGVDSIEKLPEHLRPKAPKNRKHPFPDGHRSGKGSMPAHPSANAKPGESVSVYQSRAPASRPHNTAPSVNSNAETSTTGASISGSVHVESAPTFAFTGESPSQPHTSSAAAFPAPPSPLFGNPTINDSYASTSSAADPSRNVFASSGPPQSIDPSLENMFSHPSGIHATTSPEQDDLRASASQARSGAEAEDGMDNFLAGYTNGNDEEFAFNPEAYGGDHGEQDHKTEGDSFA
jgi:histone demethylase JARID1